MPPPTAPIIIDVHTHIYPPSYLSLLTSRTTPPQLLHPDPPNPSSPTPPPRLIILPSDGPLSSPTTPPAHLGRPITPSYSSIPHILSFMQTHNISVSILSLANPWLDFLPPDSAAGWAQKINDELNAISSASRNRIRAFGCLPLSAPTTADSTTEIQRLTTSCPFIRGIIIGTSGLGLGLDDPKLDPVWAALQGCAMPVFVHPHYGLPSEVFGPRMQESGHVLPLSLGFPLETTVAFMRMWLAGVFDRFPALQVLLAHAGGGVPALAGRVQSCVEHERGFFDEGKGKRVGGPRRGLREVLQANVWLDAVGYGEVGLKGAMEVVGKERVLFGTDHPFFPPLGGEENGEWESVRTNLDAVERVFESDREGLEGVLGVNARKFFGIDGEGSDE